MAILQPRNKELCLKLFAANGGKHYSTTNSDDNDNSYEQEEDENEDTDDVVHNLDDSSKRLMPSTAK
eukprot:11175648-Ditylum_brightwellii.AAC.1